MSLFTRASQTFCTYHTSTTLQSQVLRCCRTPRGGLEQLRDAARRRYAEVARDAPCDKRWSSPLTLLRRALHARGLVVAGLHPESGLAACVEAARDRGSLLYRISGRRPAVVSGRLRGAAHG